MRLLLLAILLNTCVLSFSQVAKSTDVESAGKIIDKINANYTSEQFDLKLVYSLYEGSVDKKQLVKSFEGLVYKRGVKKYTKVQKTEIVQTKTYNLVVNHEKKMMVLSGSQNNRSTMGSFTPDEGISKLLDLCKTVKLGKNKITFIEPKGSNYNKIEVWYNSNYQMEKMAMHSSQKMPINDDKTIDKPIMLVEMKLLKNVAPESYLNYSRFLKKQAEKLVVKDEYKDYRLVKNGIDL